MSKALLYSGGLDSACAWWALGKPHAVYCGGSFGPNRHANLGEMQAIESMLAISPEFADKLTVIEYDFRPFMRPGEHHLPREMICCQLAWARGFDVAQIAWVRDDGTSAEWAATQSANFGTAVGMKDFRVEFPVRHLSKAKLIKAALDAGCPPEFIEASHSCVRQSNGHCGKCQNCKQRDAALGVACV